MSLYDVNEKQKSLFIPRHVFLQALASRKIGTSKSTVQLIHVVLHINLPSNLHDIMHVLFTLRFRHQINHRAHPSLALKMSSKSVF